MLRYESVIHEFDPYFNYRSTIKLVTEGLYEFWNWFDSDSWYPLGRVVGGTVYPGIMLTAGIVHKVLNAITAWVPLRDVCVLTGPFFAGNTVSGGAEGRQGGGRVAASNGSQQQQQQSEGERSSNDRDTSSGGSRSGSGTNSSGSSCHAAQQQAYWRVTGHVRPTTGPAF